jgi:hypothetical protein
LYQEGYLGLVHAAASYDPSRYGAFEPYALARIRRMVSNTLRSGFRLIRVPESTARRVGHEDPAALPTVRPLGDIERAEFVRMPSAPPEEAGGLVARDAVHHCFEQAIDRALRRLARRRWRGRDPLPIMRRLAAERLLIPSSAAHTALRRIATDSGVSVSRVAAYEHQLISEVSEQLRTDPRLERLLTWMFHDPAGDGLELSAGHLRDLRQAQLTHFKLRYRQSSRAEQAAVALRLIERHACDVSEVIGNLFRLAATDCSLTSHRGDPLVAFSDITTF